MNEGGERLKETMEDACVEKGDKRALAAAPENGVEMGHRKGESKIERGDEKGGYGAEDGSSDKADKCGN